MISFEACDNMPITSGAPVAQLDRVTGFEPVGRGFESLRARQFSLKNQLVTVNNSLNLGWHN